MDTPTGLARDRSHQVQSQGFRPEVDRLAPRFQGTFLRACLVGTGEQAATDLLGAVAAGTPTRCSRRGSRAFLSTRARGTHPEVFPEYGSDLVSAGNLEALSTSLAP